MKTSQSGSHKAPLNRDKLAESASIAKTSLGTSKPLNWLNIKHDRLMRFSRPPTPQNPSDRHDHPQTAQF
jgi:hypothetical protein